MDFIKSMKEYQENFFLGINYIQSEVLFLKLPALGSHHSPHHGPEGLADLEDVVLGYGGPLLLHGGLQGVGSWVRVLVGLALSIAPGAMLKGQSLWVWPAARSGPPCPRTTSTMLVRPSGPSWRPCRLPRAGILRNYDSS